MRPISGVKVLAPAKRPRPALHLPIVIPDRFKCLWHKGRKLFIPIAYRQHRRLTCPKASRDDCNRCPGSPAPDVEHLLEWPATYCENRTAGLSSEDGYPSAMTPSIVQDGGTPSSRTTSCMGVVDRPRHLGRRIVDRLREGHAGRGGAYRTSACNSSFSNSPEKHSKREAARGDSEKRSVISWRFCSFGRVFAVKH